MGAMLSSPVELIRVQRHGNANFRCAVAEMQGWRNEHEDAHEMRCDASSGSFWVLDGHGGSYAAQYSAPELVKELAPCLGRDGKLPNDELIEQGFAAVDQRLRTEIEADTERESGTTVVGALVGRQVDGTYTVKLLNCGDSRGLMVRGLDEAEASSTGVTVSKPAHIEAFLSGEIVYNKADKQPAVSWPLIAETIDHKPAFPTEKARIVAAGGFVSDEEPPRVDGNLAVSRGLGDFEYKSKRSAPNKDQKVTCVPDVYEMSGIKPGSILVLACDGVWDVMSGQDVAKFVREGLDREPKADLGDLCADLIKETLRLSSRDNVTCMVVHFVDGSGSSQEPDCQPDEMRNFGSYSSKVTQGGRPGWGEGDIDDETLNHYVKFLKRTGFTPDPRPCGHCGRWMAAMNQCPCKTIYYCCRQCQKKGWKEHKSKCTFSAGSAPTSPKGGKSP